MALTAQRVEVVIANRQHLAAEADTHNPTIACRVMGIA
jgi:hypothetical protein